MKNTELAGILSAYHEARQKTIAAHAEQGRQELFLVQEIVRQDKLYLLKVNMQRLQYELR